MANYCPNCGQPVNPGDAFCENCGTRLVQQAGAGNTGPAPNTVYPGPQNIPPQQNPFRQPDQGPVYAGNGAVREGIPQPGFSDRVNNPEILAAVSKSRKASGVWGFIMVPIPLIGFLLYALITGEMEASEAFRYGGLVSLVFLAFAIYSFIKNRPQNAYEAVVTKKYTRKRADKARDSSGNRMSSVDYDYITVARTTDGKTKKIVETDHGVIWAYENLEVGDRFRYHPQFAFPYELYDKTHAVALHCVACGTKNPVSADRCKRCNVPLLK